MVLNDQIVKNEFYNFFPPNGAVEIHEKVNIIRNQDMQRLDYDLKHENELKFNNFDNHTFAN